MVTPSGSSQREESDVAVRAQIRNTPPEYRSEFRRGALAMVPIWFGAAPFGVAMGITAMAGGFSSFETLALSMLVFAGAAQIATITLFAGGASLLGITLTVFLLNLRHVLYSLSLNRQFPERAQPGRPLLAFFLTDETYGVATRDHLDGRGGDGFYFGAALSLYVVYCLATLAGVLLGAILPDPDSIGLDFIFPLMFVVLLVPLLGSRRQVLVACTAGVVALALGQVADGGTTILGATIAAAALGAWIDGD